ncbi:hypothetical protein HYV89_00690 [Candidatus Woesearchaeota archaeon]|nr:hypothetical protein [Candidatus Woesearchaeota archaeon]
MILATEKDLMKYYSTTDFKREEGIKQLKDMNLLPLIVSKNPAFQQFIITLGFRYSDGCIYEQKNNRSITFYVCFSDKIDALNFCSDVKKFWNICLEPHLNGIYYVYLPASLGRLMVHVGSPIGNKNYQNFRIPIWIFDLEDSLKWKFIDGLFSGDGETPRLKKSKLSCESLKFSLNAKENLVEDFSSGFMKDVMRLLSGFGIKVTEPKICESEKLISKEGIVTYPIAIRVLTEKKNMIKFLENVPYTYRKRAKIQEILKSLKYKNKMEELKGYLHNYDKSEPPNICVLLRKGWQKKLIVNAANKISHKKFGQYKKLSYYLKEKCKSFDQIDVSSIFDVYIPLWKKNKKFIPIDCAIELMKLNNLNSSHLENNIYRMKILRTHNKYSVRFN